MQCSRRRRKNDQFLYTNMPRAHAETYAQCAHHSRSSAMLSDCSQLTADGGCSTSLRLRQLALVHAAQDLAHRPCVLVCEALGPGRLSFNRENSLAGRALQATPTTPEKQSFWSRCMTLFSRISCVSCTLLSGQLWPANKSRKRRGGLLVSGRCGFARCSALRGRETHKVKGYRGCKQCAHVGSYLGHLMQCLGSPSSWSDASSAQILRSACSSSWACAARRPESGARLCVARS